MKKSHFLKQKKITKAYEKKNETKNKKGYEQSVKFDRGE